MSYFGSGTDLKSLLILFLLLCFFLLGDLLKNVLRLRRFKVNLGEIWKECSLSK